jgi:hypothetical protein
MLGQLAFRLSGTVDRMAIDDQKDLPLPLAHQASQERQEYGRSESLLKDHKTEQRCPVAA